MLTSKLHITRGWLIKTCFCISPCKNVDSTSSWKLDHEFYCTMSCNRSKALFIIYTKLLFLALHLSTLSFTFSFVFYTHLTLIVLCPLGRLVNSKVFFFSLNSYNIIIHNCPPCWFFDNIFESCRIII